MPAMERLLPPPTAEPAIPDSAGYGALRSTTYLLLGLMLAGGAWVRFNTQIAQAVPALAGPAAEVADRLEDAGRAKALVELALLPAAEAQASIATMALPAGEATQLAAALERRRLRLIHMPLLDLSPSLPDGGRLVRVSASGYTRLVRLSRVPVSVTLPIGPVGTVSFQTIDGQGVDIGTVTLAGLMRLPDLPAGARMDVGVIAQ
jgi:hypothetical protein